MSLLKPNRKTSSCVVVLLLFACLPAVAGTKKVVGETVDAGTFAVYISGKKVAAETFEITKTPDTSTLKAELKVDEGGKGSQKIEMTMAPNGDLRRYQWSENGKGQAVVEPKDEFLVEHVTLTDQQKTAEQPFILPVSTSVLDDYFFS